MTFEPTLMGGPQEKSQGWPSLDKHTFPNVPNPYLQNSSSYSAPPSLPESSSVANGLNFVYGSGPPVLDHEPTSTTEEYYAAPYIGFYNLYAPEDPLSSQLPRPSFANADGTDYPETKVNPLIGQMTPQSIDLSVNDTTNLVSDPINSLLSYNMDMSRPGASSQFPGGPGVGVPVVPPLPLSSTGVPYQSPKSEHNYTRRATEPILSPLCSQFNPVEDPVETELFSCPVCAKIFTKRHSLKLHMKSHSTEKPYKCSKCEKTFARCHDMKRHEQLHKGIKVYRCEGVLRDGHTKWGCGKKFARSDALTRHLRAGAGWRCLKPLIDETKALDENSLIEYARQTARNSIDASMPMLDSSEQHRVLNCDPIPQPQFSTEPEYYQRSLG